MPTFVIDDMREHLEYARQAREDGDGKAVAHNVRNAGAVLANLQKESDAAKIPRPRCESCGRRPIVERRPEKDRFRIRQARQEFREAKRMLGVDAVARDVEAFDNEGRQIGYGLDVKGTNPN